MKQTDRADDRYLRRQYRTQDNLNVRIRTHELYGVPEVDFASWVLDKINWQGNEWVLDVGCGSGIYVEPARERAARYIAGDLSLGMLQKLKQQDLQRVNLDAQALPLADDSVDVLLANHMLYHVPDQDAAVREFVRALHAAGRLLAATNSAGNMAELGTLGNEALALLGVNPSTDISPTLSFTLEGGRSLLERHFAHVERHDLPGALVFPEAEPVIAYLGSSRERFERALPSDSTWEDVVVALKRLLSVHIAEHGHYRVNKLTGVFVCHN